MENIILNAKLNAQSTSQMVLDNWDICKSVTIKFDYRLNMFKELEFEVIPYKGSLIKKFKGLLGIN